MGWRHLLLSLDGRVSRRSFWTGLLLPYLALNMVVAVVAPPLRFNECMLALWVAGLWPFFAVGTKRCHDRGRSGWFQLISLIPVVGALWLFVDLAILPGTDGPNSFGPAPLR